MSKPPLRTSGKTKGEDPTGSSSPVPQASGTLPTRASDVTLRRGNTGSNVPTVTEIFGVEEKKGSEYRGETAPPPPTNLPPIHRRNVSWGQDVVDMPKPKTSHDRVTSDASIPSTIQQPDFGDFTLGESARIYNSRRKFSDVDIALNDLTRNNPIEAEAESYIIRAIEAREPSLHSGADGVSPILSHLNDEAVDSLTSSAKSSDQDNSQPKDQPPGSPRHVRKTSKLPTIRAARTKHRRSQTMEQQLHGLASAIDAIHAQHTTAYDEPEPVSIDSPRKRTNTLDSAASPLEKSRHEPLSSGDAFQQNASLLYRRIRKEGEDELDKSSGSRTSQGSGGALDMSASARWRKLKNVVHATGGHPKKTDAIIAEEEEDEEEAPGGPQTADVETGGDDSSSGDKHYEKQESGGSGGSRFPRPGLMIDEWKFAQDFRDFVNPIRGSIRLYIKVALFYIMIPATGIAAILFYLAGNPPTGVLINGGKPVNGTVINTNGIEVPSYVASSSWWLLFICVRQLVTFTMAKWMELFVIDFLAIRSGLIFKLFGPWPTLFIMQARGWPFIVFFWSIFDFALLSGPRSFSAHWLFWQNAVRLFNTSNPSGDVADSLWNHRVLAIAICVSAVTAIKRFWMGLYLGKQTFTQYSDKLASVMKKILLISQVAGLAKDFERKTRHRFMKSERAVSIFTEDKLEDLMQDADDDSSAKFNRSERSLGGIAGSSMANRCTPVIDPDDRHPLTGKLSATQKTRMVQLLGAWEEPTVAEKTIEPISVNALLQFRRALACLSTDFPFSGSFGPAGTREDAIASSQEVYERLLLRLPDQAEALNFEVLATLGVQPDGSLDQQKVVELIRLFRPDRDGTLSMVDFVRSIDKVYREIRLLRASVNNSSKIDSALETIFNIVFYAVVITIVLAAIGLDPLALFLSISGVVLAFAFMISSASSKYFEGLLFILVRRPYSIGDGIVVGDVNSTASSSGSGWWLVEDVNLFTTTVVFLFTNERATLSNGSLANSRIINSTRSPHAGLFNMLKFPINVSYAKLEIYRQALEEYVRNRPREWLAMTSFRAVNVEAALGYVEYIVCVDHRESWAAWRAIRTSQAHLASFSVELSKKLNIWYQSPPLPVNLTFMNGSGNVVMGPASPTGDPTDTSMELSPNSTAYSPDVRSLLAKFAPSSDQRS